MGYGASGWPVRSELLTPPYSSSRPFVRAEIQRRLRWPSSGDQGTLLCRPHQKQASGTSPTPGMTIVNPRREKAPMPLGKSVKNRGGLKSLPFIRRSIAVALGLTGERKPSASVVVRPPATKQSPLPCRGIRQIVAEPALGSAARCECGAANGSFAAALRRARSARAHSRASFREFGRLSGALRRSRLRHGFLTRATIVINRSIDRSSQETPEILGYRPDGSISSWKRG
jgi:hypothetical protein